jgi:glycosyltransferase involved in cell wall biosynthesis
MSMSLPVIASNWSGVTAYLDNEVGYPIAIDGLVRAEGWRLGLKWAQPSVSHLRSLMRRVFENRGEARARGAAARRRVVQRYSRPAIAAALVRELRRIEAALPRGGG